MPQAFRSLRHFLGRVLSDLPSAIGSNRLGVLFPLVPAVLWFLYQGYQSGWLAVSHDIWVGFIITVISYGLLLLYCIVRNVYREHVSQIAKTKKVEAELECIRNIPPWAGYESEQAWRDAIDEQNRLVNLGHSVDGRFASLQIDALRLANELRQFITNCGEPPVVDRSQYLGDIEGHLREVYRVVDPFHEKIQANYELKFQGRIEEIRKRFAAEGIQSDALKESVTGRRNLITIRSLALVLWHLAAQVGDVKVDDSWTVARRLKE